MGLIVFDEFGEAITYELWEVQVDDSGSVQKIRLLLDRFEDEGAAHTVARQHVLYHEDQGSYILPVAVFDSEGFSVGAAHIPKFRKSATKAEVDKARAKRRREELLIDPESAVHDDDRKEA